MAKLRSVVSQLDSCGSTHPTGKSKCHCLLPADTIHQESTYDAPRQVKAVDCSAKSDTLDERVIGIQSIYNCGRKYSEWVRYEVIPVKRMSVPRN